jgi:hypothetical protein
MNQRTTGEDQKDKTLFDYILENKTTIIVVLGMILFFSFIRDTREIIEITNPFEPNYGEQYRQVSYDVDNPEALKLGGAIKKLKSQLRNSK